MSWIEAEGLSCPAGIVPGSSNKLTVGNGVKCRTLQCGCQPKGALSAAQEVRATTTLRTGTSSSKGGVKGGEKVYHCCGGIGLHLHDEKGLNLEPDEVRSGAGGSAGPD